MNNGKVVFITKYHGVLLGKYQVYQQKYLRNTCYSLFVFYLKVGGNSALQVMNGKPERNEFHEILGVTENFPLWPIVTGR